MIEEVRRLAQIDDHEVRAREAAKLMAELQESVQATARMPRESIQWLRDHGHSMADVWLGTSRAGHGAATQKISPVITGHIWSGAFPAPPMDVSVGVEGPHWRERCGASKIVSRRRVV